MKKIVKELAEKAGFIMWEDEDWKPTNSAIDWACHYDRELEQFFKLAVEHANNGKEIKDKEIDWDKVQTVDQLKTVVRLLVNAFGGSSKLTVNNAFFERANEETIKRVNAICKEEKNT